MNVELEQDDNAFEDADYQYNQYLLQIKKKEYEFDSRRQNIEKQKKYENNKNSTNWHWID